MTASEVKQHALKKRGILSHQYVLLLEVPKSYVSKPQENIGISPHFVTNEEFKKCMYFVRSSSVSSLLENSIILEVIVPEPYFEKFSSNLIKVESINIIKEQTNE